MIIMEENKVHSISPSSSNDNEGGKSKKVRSLISDYAEQTTLHGFYYFIRGGNKIRQLIWLLFIFCSFACFTYQFAVLVNDFLERKKLTQTEIITKRKMLFPAITICNYNPIRKTQIQAALRDLKGEKKGNLRKNWLSSRRSSAINDPHFGKQVDLNKVDIGTLFLNSGHKMDEDGMLVGCKWKGKACTANDFRSSAQSIGLCHTFNSGKQRMKTSLPLTFCKKFP